MSLNTGKPTPVHLPAAIIGSAVADIPSELGYVTASITADAVWTLPSIQQPTGSIVEGSALTVHNPTFFAITLLCSGSDLIDTAVSIVVLANSTAVLFSTFTGWCLSSNDVNDASYIDPFHGWWSQVIRQTGSLNSLDAYGAGKLYYIDMSKRPIVVTAYEGPADAIREHTPSDGAPKYTYYEKIDENTLVWINTVNPDTYYLLPSFRLQADKTIAAGTVNIEQAWIGGVLYSIYKKIDNPPPIRPFNDQEIVFQGADSSKDCSNAKFMFDEFCDFQLTFQPMTNPAMGYTQYPGYTAFKGHQVALTTTGVTYSTPIVKVQKTLPGGFVASKTQPSPTKFTTTFICLANSHVTPFSQVTISGCIGPLVVLNGTYNVLLVNNIGAVDTDVNYMNASNQQYVFSVELNTLALAANSLGYLTDSLAGATVTVTHGPVNEGTEYRQLLDAMYDMFKFAFTFDTHSIIRYYRPSSGSLLPFDTFANLQAGLRAGTAVSASFSFKNNMRGSGFYNNLNLCQRAGAVPSSQVVPYNNTFGINAPSLSSIWSYNIPIANYLDQTPGFEPRNIWWKLIGQATVPVQQEAGLLYYGNPNLGQTFSAITWPYAAGVPPPAATTDDQYFQLGNTTRNSFSTSFAQQYVFGRIKPTYTGGANIGYLRLYNFGGYDVVGGYMRRSEFAPAPPSYPINTGTASNPRINIEALCYVYSVGMTYIRSMGCTKVIIDMRDNGGGDLGLLFVVSSFFGGDRMGTDPSDLHVDTGFSKILQAPGNNIRNYDIYNDAINRSLRTTDNILPSLNNTYYPGSTFQGAGSRVYLLDDIGAGSAGDVFPSMFLGDSLNKNIGTGTVCKIFGDINGILCGTANFTVNLTTSAASYVVTDSSYQPISIMQLRTEKSTSSGKLRPAPFSLCNRPDIAGYRPLQPDTPAAPVNYLGTGPWPNNWEDNAYQDIGAVPYTLPAGLRLPGDVRVNPNPLPLYPAQPVVGDRLLWRDCWLEQTVLDAMQP